MSSGRGSRLVTVPVTRDSRRTLQQYVHRYIQNSYLPVTST
jgi:hypothetical protein